MNPTLLLLIAAALSSATFAHAHVVPGAAGTPKAYCENHLGGQNTHDYALAGLAGGQPFLYYQIDGNTDDCDGDGIKYDWDGHAEFALGGAWIISSEAGGYWGPGGASTCFGQDAHHAIFPTVSVVDQVWPYPEFVVAADQTNLVGADPVTGYDCGDNVDDTDTGLCLSSCQVNFYPGADGAYHVYVLNHASLASCSPSIYVNLNPVDACVLYEPNNPHFAAAGHVITN